MATARSFENLEAWQMGRQLVGDIYRSTASGAFGRDFGLRDQVRRAGVSVISNIGEGFERGGDKEFVRFLTLAKGSCGEVRTQLYVARDLDYLDEDSFVRLQRQAKRTGEIIAGLIRYLKNTEVQGKNPNRNLAKDFE